jgi:hypothetical protein
VIVEIVCGGVGFGVCRVLGKLPGIGRFFQRLEGDAFVVVGAVTIVLVMIGWSLVSVDWRGLIDA